MSDDNGHLPELTQRQEQILNLIIEAYTHRAEPVSSKYVVENSALEVSSATVRNEMAALEELGYLQAPHKSAGRVPTAQGYRYFVRGLMTTSALTISERQHIAARFGELPLALEQWMRQAATVLARTAHIASLVTPPVADVNYFKHVELIAIQGRLVLMVLVVRGGMVHQRMLNLAEPVAQSVLSEAADRINVVCEDLSPTQMRLKSGQLSTLEGEIVMIAAELIEHSGSHQVRALYRDGLSEIINHFPHSEGAQQAVRVFEERSFLEAILTEVLQPLIDDGDVQVVIAGNDQWENISHLSLVLSRYGVPGQMSGALGVLGPTNINYGRAISTVRHVSGLMTDMLVDLYSDPSQAAGDDEDPPAKLPPRSTSNRT